MSSRDLEQVRSFFDHFVTAFASFDGLAVSAPCLAPYVAFDASGRFRLFETREALASYFQAALDEYRQRACRRCRYKDLTTVAMGSGRWLATCTWELLGDGDELLLSWRESYHLMLAADGLKAFASLDHPA